MFTPSTSTRSFLGKAARIVPVLPLSLPEITITLSPFLTCILSHLLDTVVIDQLKNFWCKRNDLHEAVVTKFTSNRSEDTGSTRAFVVSNDDTSVFVKFDVCSINTTNTTL